MGGRTTNTNRDFRKQTMIQYCVPGVSITNLNREILYLWVKDCSRRRSERQVCRTPQREIGTAASLQLHSLQSKFFLKSSLETQS